MNKEDVPVKVFEILGIKFDPEKHTSAGGTVTKDAWLDVLKRLEELKAENKLID